MTAGSLWGSSTGSSAPFCRIHWLNSLAESKCKNKIVLPNHCDFLLVFRVGKDRIKNHLEIPFLACSFLCVKNENLLKDALSSLIQLVCFVLPANAATPNFSFMFRLQVNAPWSFSHQRRWELQTLEEEGTEFIKLVRSVWLIKKILFLYFMVCYIHILLCFSIGLEQNEPWVLHLMWLQHGFEVIVSKCQNYYSMDRNQWIGMKFTKWSQKAI